MRHYHEYDSFIGLVEHAVKHADAGNGASHRPDKKKEWSGTAHFDEAVKLATRGWKEGYEAVKQQSEALYGRVTAKMPVQETVFREAPDVAVLDMGRVMEGAPECWMEQEDTDRYEDKPSNKTVHIVMNCTVSCGVDQKTIFTRGAAAVALAEALELAGRSVKISIVIAIGGGWMTNTQPGETVELRATVKDYDGRANYDLLAFALAHPAMLRRIGFAELESFPQDVRHRFGFSLSGCYGSVIETGLDKGDLYFGGGHYDHQHWRSADTAEKWILTQLKAQGVHIIGEE